MHNMNFIALRGTGEAAATGEPPAGALIVEKRIVMRNSVVRAAYGTYEADGELGLERRGLLRGQPEVAVTGWP